MIHSIHTQLAEGPFHAKDFRIIFWFPRSSGLISLEFSLFLQPSKLGFHKTNQLIWGNNPKLKNVQVYVLPDEETYHCDLWECHWYLHILLARHLFQRNHGEWRSLQCYEHWIFPSFCRSTMTGKVSWGSPWFLGRWSCTWLSAELDKHPGDKTSVR